jgi:hypothetical protein
MQCILYKIYFWKVFHMYYKLICIFICTRIWTKKFILVKSGCYRRPGWGPFYRVRAGEARWHRGGRWPAMVGIQLPTVSWSKRGRGLDGCRASAGELRRPGGALVRLHWSVGGRPSAARDAAAWPDVRRRLGHPEEGERPRVGRCWAAKARWAGALWRAETSRWAIIAD